MTRPQNAALLLVALLATPTLAQFEDDYRPGLLATYSSADGTSFTRVDRSLSLMWGARPPDPRLGVGPFSAKWTGYLASQVPGEYRLAAYAQGRVTIKLDGQTLLDAESPRPGWLEAKPVEIPFDFHELEVTFKKTADEAQLALYWSGPQFQLEPVSARLFFDVDAEVDERFERGSLLVRALRCGACHELPGQLPPVAAPALDKLAGNLSRAWLIDWLASETSAPADKGETAGEIARRMPHFDLSRTDAEAAAAFLLSGKPDLKPAPKAPKPKGKSDNKKNADEEEEPKAETGEELFLATGCLACHRAGEFGSSGLFGGGDLSAIAAKRPADFFNRWLHDPAAVNRRHRMPVFELSAEEREKIAAHLGTLSGSEKKGVGTGQADARQIARGREVVRERRCNGCHALEAGKETARPTLSVAALSLSAESKWDAACTGEPDAKANRPGYRLSEEDRDAVAHFVAAVSGVKNAARPVVDGAYLLAENNCLACHRRDESPGLAPKLTPVAAAHGQLAPLVPAMTPPPLVSVGDKLFDAALVDAIRRKQLHRPWLAVRMPKFDLSDDELAALAKHFINADRIPKLPKGETAGSTPHALDAKLLDLAGARLVTPDGFGCTSCHQVGKVLPVKAPLNARGPDLSMLQERIRKPWYDRWVRNPARIVPNMEMPSVQIPVRGVLDEQINDQLAAVWHVLNTPGFQPPEPNPVRVVRRSGVPEQHERAAVLTDVLNVGKETLIKPLLFGLANRHNVLIDLERGTLAGWWLGDTARQRTKGKTWFWEAAGSSLLTGESAALPASLDMRLIIGGKEIKPRLVGQFPTEFDELRHVPGGVAFTQRLHFAEGVTLFVTQTITSATHERTGGAPLEGFRRSVTVRGVPDGAQFLLDVLSSDEIRFAGDARSLPIPGPNSVGVRLVEPREASFTRDGNHVQIVLSPHGAGDELAVAVEYTSELPVDRFPLILPEVPQPEAMSLNVVPGFEATLLPLADEFMPTGIAWRPDGALVVSSLKGRVWLARDTDDDGLEDRLTVFSDELAAPFGVAAADGYVDAIAKYALLRLLDDDGDGFAERMVNVASGWGHTADYHDWAVGLPRDKQGDYYIGIPCQQDQRSPAAANLRGTVIRLVPRSPTPDNPRLFSLDPLSGGHRFPIGAALNGAGDVFVTDNQGNYNPFNELNHVQRGARYGFINAIERKPDFKPPLTPPAIDIPHPWTRSVNGICFLDTPADVRRALGRDLFGPHEGHLVGCEFDTRRLIRMSLQRVGDTYQGCAYPFSYETPPEGPALLGPLTCAVAPDGDLYIGSLRDSGWGGANNIGELVRMRPNSGSLPAGIAEVRATARGFEIDFAQPVDKRLAVDPQNYNLSSYTRVSTPAYGGPDVDRRSEKLKSLKVSDDGLHVTLELAELREGYVYEFQLKNLTGDAPFFPAEAHYTLRKIP